jgi:hypothetical protein
MSDPKPPPLPPSERLQPQLVEQTAKRFKAVQAIGAGAAIGGGAGILIAARVDWPFLAGCSVIIASMGVLAYFIARVLAWWYHG